MYSHKKKIIYFTIKIIKLQKKDFKEINFMSTTTKYKKGQ